MPDSSAPSIDELERIRLAYRQRDADPSYGARYTYFNRLNLFSIQQQERSLLLALARQGVESLSGKRILDVGCGTGGVLRNYLRYGAQAENLCGIDLMPDRIEQARQRLPAEVDLRAQDVQTLPFAEETFDLISQWVVFSSILDDQIKHNIAQEMLRCLKPDGVIIWCDMARTPLLMRCYGWILRQGSRMIRVVRQPSLLWRRRRTKHLPRVDAQTEDRPLLAVQSVPAKEIERLFPSCQYCHEYIIPSFEVNAPIVSRSWFLAEALAASKLLNFWILSTIRKTGQRDAYRISDS